MATPSDLSKTGPALVFGLINAANPSTFPAGPASATNVTLGVPSALTGDPSGQNTKLTVTAIANQGYTGSQDITYNRLDFTAVLNVKTSNNLSIVDQSFATIADVIAYLNSTYNLNIQATDTSNETAAISGAYPKSAEIIADAASLTYIGNVTFTITQPQVALSSAIANTSMDGLTAPTS